jgi:hypothetical protein
MVAGESENDSLITVHISGDKHSRSVQPSFDRHLGAAIRMGEQFTPTKDRTTAAISTERSSEYEQRAEQNRKREQIAKTKLIFRVDEDPRVFTMALGSYRKREVGVFIHRIAKEIGRDAEEVQMVIVQLTGSIGSHVTRHRIEISREDQLVFEEFLQAVENTQIYCPNNGAMEMIHTATVVMKECGGTSE